MFIKVSNKLNKETRTLITVTLDDKEYNFTDKEAKSLLTQLASARPDLVEEVLHHNQRVEELEDIVSDLESELEMKESDSYYDED